MNETSTTSTTESPIYIIDELNRDVPTLSGPVVPVPPDESLSIPPATNGEAIRAGSGNGNIVIRPVGDVAPVINPFFSSIDLQVRLIYFNHLYVHV